MDWQTLKVTGRPVDGFNSLVQTINFTGQTVPFNQATGAVARPTRVTSICCWSLCLRPCRASSQDRGFPGATDTDLVVACHTLIDTVSGISFLPLNDSRWTMEGGGYIIVLPSSGVLTYTDDTVAAGHGVDHRAFQSQEVDLDNPG